MSQSPEPVTVRIVDREYRVMCTPEQRRTLMESALFLDQQMREIRDSGKVSSMDKIAVMAALNLAEEVLKLRQQMHERRDQVDSRVRDLADRLDRALERD
ncbi:cell division protein ZapA [Wenzhouxiangella sediminis]|jgi:cell division protein ZapA|uniref:Cell division protein ZapA n=1 Tax=Wenzhouxiangella sediminis TaxID=1792836 RepID=A0A3E1KAE9_9GAMM|nr:cell division protein ZapA [Wenzhouxiangella sediminis]MEE4304523.1 cell division protein ZapA [Wenzhouxiangella sp.]RFF31281.1 cell division protein ZapA [Wenzhouxiangella sediminis]